MLDRYTTGPCCNLVILGKPTLSVNSKHPSFWSSCIKHASSTGWANGLQVPAWSDQHSASPSSPGEEGRQSQGGVRALGQPLGTPFFRPFAENQGRRECNSRVAALSCPPTAFVGGKAMAKVTGLGHFGIYVTDMPKM